MERKLYEWGSREIVDLYRDFLRILKCVLVLIVASCASLPNEQEADNLDLYAIASGAFEVPSRYSTGHYPTVLYRVTDGAIVEVRSITSHDQGSLFTRVFHDKGYALIGSEGSRPGSILLDVLDMRSLGYQKSYDLDACANCVYSSSYLLNQPNGFVFLVHMIAAESDPQLEWSNGGVSSLGNNHTNNGFFLSLRPSGATLRDDESWFLGIDLVRQRVIADLDYGMLRNALTYGASGGLVEGEDYVYPVHETNGEAVVYLGNTPYPLGWRLPDLLWPNATNSDPYIDVNGREVSNELPTSPVTVQTVHNRYARVVADAGHRIGINSQRVFHVFDKASKTWAHVVWLGDLFQMRAYGPWIAFEELYSRKQSAAHVNYLNGWRSQHKHQQTEHERLDAQRAPYSLYAKAPYERPSTAERLEKRRVNPAGWLHLYHVSRRQRVSHHTGEINSEVLYVDDQNRVYYRVNDELRRARVMGSNFIDITVLAKHPVILSVHHLFFGKY